MNFIFNYGLFLLKIMTLIIIFAGFIIALTNLSLKKRNANGRLRITNLSDKYQIIKKDLQLAKIQPQTQKQWLKIFKKETKKKLKLEKLAIKTNYNQNKKSTLYIIDFKGSMDAKEVYSLREEVSAILSTSDKTDEVLVRLESAGGIVNGYGLAASQLQRLRNYGLNVTIAIDKIAASGGYMMACVAHCILAAPFSIVGSIGVIAQIPNFNKLLKRNDIDIELHTAGQYKRTLTLFGENTDEGRSKFQKELSKTHSLFKEFVHNMRPALDINNVSTGEYWYGSEALELGLVDKIGTSDDFIINKINSFNVLSINYVQKRNTILNYIIDNKDIITKYFLTKFISK
ncbi:MAG: protease SohB [Pantoea sp. Brub]|nr:protease SohB [Pantoea sp. Brub]